MSIMPSPYDDGPPIPDRPPSFVDQLNGAPHPADDPTGPSGPGTKPGSLGTLAVRRASQVVPGTVRWLWASRIAYAKLNVLGGPPGVGKSYLTCALAAAVSTGSGLPGDTRDGQPPARVLLLSYEDDAEDTLRPRLDLLGADLDLVELVEGVEGDGKRRAFGPADVPVLAGYLDTYTDVGLLVVDPVSAFVGSGTDEYRANEVRAALEELRVLGQERGFATVLVMHTRKSAADTALNRLSGSQAYGALVRSALMAGPIEDDEDGRHALAHVKHNLAAKQPTLAYSVGEDGLAWHGEVAADAEEVAGNSDGTERSAAEEAAAFLREVLADGPVPARTVLAEADAAGIAEKTLKRAKKRLGVASDRGDGAWSWRLPDPPTGPTGPGTERGPLDPLGPQPVTDRGGTGYRDCEDCGRRTFGDRCRDCQEAAA